MQGFTVPLGARNPTGRTSAEVVAALRGRAELTVFDEMDEVGGMTLVVVDQAEEAFLNLVLAVNYDLRLFVNDVTDGLTAGQIEALTESDFAEASFLGYAPASLAGGGWTVADGDPAVGTYPKRSFTSTANQAAQTVYGYYVTRTADGALMWFEEFPDPVSVDSFGQFIRVTPRMTLADSED